MRLKKLSSLKPVKREFPGSGKITYHRKLLGARLGEVTWIEITEEEYKRIMDGLHTTARDQTNPRNGKKRR